MIYSPIKTIHTLPKLIPSGSIALNLRLSNSRKGAYPVGKLINIIGDSYAGKTFLFWAMLAEVNKCFPELFNLFYDEPERDFNLDVPYLFGKTLLPRVHTSHSSDEVEDSVTIEDFLRQSKRIFRKYRNCIYGLDSFDTLYSEKEDDNEEPGYKAAKRVRILNEGLRRLVPIMKERKNTLFIISQVRHNLKSAGFGNPDTRSGGRALKHWANIEFWLKVVKTLTSGKGKNKDDIGALVRARVTKVRGVGYKGKITFPLYIDLGLDDTGSQIDLLLENNYIKKDNVLFGGYKSRQKIIKHIESNNLEKKLSKFTEQCWLDKQEKKKLKDRKRRYK